MTLESLLKTVLIAADITKEDFDIFGRKFMPSNARRAFVYLAVYEYKLVKCRKDLCWFLDWDYERVNENIVKASNQIKQGHILNELIHEIKRLTKNGN